MNPEEILTKKTLSEPHRAYVDPGEREENEVQALSRALKNMMRKELLNGRNPEGGMNLAVRQACKLAVSLLPHPPFLFVLTVGENMLILFHIAIRFT